MPVDLRSADVELIYLELGEMGRGEVLRVLMNAWGIPYRDTRWAFDPATWPERKAQLIASGDNPAAKVPVLKINGVPHTEHMAIARYLAASLGYYGKDHERDYLADAVADSYQDWCNRWVEVTFFTKDADVKKKYLDEDRWATFKVFEHFLSKYPEGPFIGGKEFSYADAAVYQMIVCEEQTSGQTIRTEATPLLSKLYTAFEELPKIGEYLKARKPKA